MNVTTVGSTAPSFLTFYPADSGRPNASQMNTTPDIDVRFNGFDVKLSADGKFKVYNDQGSSHLIIDVLGVYVPAPAAAGPQPSLWFYDSDGDGYGGRGEITFDVVLAVTPPPAYVANNDDCVDYDTPLAHGADINPAATEVPFGGDENCDGILDWLAWADVDGDGSGDNTNVITFQTFVLGGGGVPAGYVSAPADPTGISPDCDDTDPTIFPWAFDPSGDGIDQNCDGVDG